MFNWPSPDMYFLMRTPRGEENSMESKDICCGSLPSSRASLSAHSSSRKRKLSLRRPLSSESRHSWDMSDLDDLGDVAACWGEFDSACGPVSMLRGPSTRTIWQSRSTSCCSLSRFTSRFISLVLARPSPAQKSSWDVQALGCCVGPVGRDFLDLHHAPCLGTALISSHSLSIIFFILCLSIIWSSFFWLRVFKVGTKGYGLEGAGGGFLAGFAGTTGCDTGWGVAADIETGTDWQGLDLLWSGAHLTGDSGAAETPEHKIASRNSEASEALESLGSSCSKKEVVAAGLTQLCCPMLPTLTELGEMSSGSFKPFLQALWWLFTSSWLVNWSRQKQHTKTGPSQSDDEVKKHLR